MVLGIFWLLFNIYYLFIYIIYSPIAIEIPGSNRIRWSVNPLIYVHLPLMSDYKFETINTFIERKRNSWLFWLEKFKFRQKFELSVKWNVTHPFWKPKSRRYTKSRSGHHLLNFLQLVFWPVAYFVLPLDTCPER